MARKPPTLSPATSARAPLRRASRTSISGALNFGKLLFDDSGYRGVRRVSTFPAMAPTNSGRWSPSCETRWLPPASPSTACRSCSSARVPSPWTWNGSTSISRTASSAARGFAIPIRARDQFKDTIPASWCWMSPAPPAPRLVRAQPPPRISCTIGEQMSASGGGISLVRPSALSNRAGVVCLPSSRSAPPVRDAANRETDRSA